MFKKSPMRYYPVFLDISDKPAVVVGGGEVAERKAAGLLEAGAVITVISPRVTEKLKGLADKGQIKILKRGYKKGDLKGYRVAVCAASKEINKAAYSEAASSNILVNVVDDPAHCSFIVPSVVKRGSLVIAISTSGKSPALAKTMRKYLEKRIGKEYGAFTEILGAVRKKLKYAAQTPGKRGNKLKSSVIHDKKERVINALAGSPIPGWLKEGSTGKIEKLLRRLLGEGYTLKELGIRLKNRDRAAGYKKETI